MNYFDIQNNFLTITRPHSNLEEIVNGLNEYILNNECEHLGIDISVLNIIDAVNAGVSCSTSHFSKYPFGSIELIVKDLETKNLLKKLSLKTVKTNIKRPIINHFFQPVCKKIVDIR